MKNFSPVGYTEEILLKFLEKYILLIEFLNKI